MKEAVQEILAHFEELASNDHKRSFSHFKIDDSKAFGIKLPLIREMAKPLKNEHELALALWEEGHHETKLLATMVADPSKFTAEEADNWVEDFYSWDVCDQAATNLFRKTNFIWDKIFEWFDREGEYQRRAGFSNLAVLTVHHKTAPDELFLNTFHYLEKYADDERNFVKKAINWAIREMGKRRKSLHEPCIDLCYRLVEKESKSAKWIARDALRELESEKVQQRLNKIK